MVKNGSPRLPPDFKPIGIKEIAKRLGVSIGTVDRALHQRPGINPMTRAKVLKMAQTMGYRPNLAACHCLLFVNSEGEPITEYLPEDHPGRSEYGLVKDPTPDKGRPLRSKAVEREEERRQRHS